MKIEKVDAGGGCPIIVEKMNELVDVVNGWQKIPIFDETVGVLAELVDAANDVMRDRKAERAHRSPHLGSSSSERWYHGD